jgi:hypothetical protein
MRAHTGLSLAFWAAKGVPTAECMHTPSRCIACDRQQHNAASSTGTQQLGSSTHTHCCTAWPAPKHWQITGPCHSRAAQTIEQFCTQRTKLLSRINKALKGHIRMHARTKLPVHTTKAIQG